MSRTFRRKGYEKTKNTSWHKEFNSVAGFYTEYDYEWVNTDLYGHCVHGTYRKPTKQEFSQKYWDVHADGRYAYNRFSSYWRKEANRRVRRVNDSEILKWMKNEDHEVILQKVEDLVDIWFYY